MFIRTSSISLPLLAAVFLSACEGTTSQAAHHLSGDVVGLKGTLLLTNNGVETLTLEANGAFAFHTSLKNGERFKVTVSRDPQGEHCEVANDEGTMEHHNITTVVVSCVPRAREDSTPAENAGALSVN